MTSLCWQNEREDSEIMSSTHFILRIAGRAPMHIRIDNCRYYSLKISIPRHGDDFCLCMRMRAACFASLSELIRVTAFFADDATIAAHVLQLGTSLIQNNKKRKVKDTSLVF